MVFNPEAFTRIPENKQEPPMSTSTIEPGFINKLVEMFKYRQILRDLKQDIEQHDGLSQGYVRTEGQRPGFEVSTIC